MDGHNGYFTSYLWSLNDHGLDLPVSCFGSQERNEYLPLSKSEDGGPQLKDKTMQIKPVQKQTSAQHTRFKTWVVLLLLVTLIYKLYVLKQYVSLMPFIHIATTICMVACFLCRGLDLYDSVLCYSTDKYLYEKSVAPIILLKALFIWSFYWSSFYTFSNTIYSLSNCFMYFIYFWTSNYYPQASDCITKENAQSHVTIYPPQQQLIDESIDMNPTVLCHAEHNTTNTINSHRIHLTIFIFNYTISNQ